MDHIFVIENDVVTVNTNVLQIPELNAVYRKYGDTMALSYCHFMTDPYSPYYNTDKTVQSDDVYKAFPGDYKVTDKVVCDAYNFLYDYRVKRNVTIRLHEAAGVMIDKISNYLYTAEIDDSKDGGNIAHISRIINTLDKAIKNYISLTKARDEEIKKIVGSKQLGYDQDR